MYRTSPNKIYTLQRNQIFVFGSNEAGRHGAGAAKFAKTNFGAKSGIGFGLSGNSFAIPTKDKKIKTLPLRTIKEYVDRFVSFAKDNPDKTFLVTEIGCGLAGYHPKDIAPLFKDSIKLQNVWLPDRFWNELKDELK